MLWRKKVFFTVLTILIFFFTGIISFVLPRSAVLAMQPTPSDDQVNAIASELFCPVCENIPLDVCDTEACRQWRALIKQMLTEGKSEEEIKQYFAESYGVRVLAEPPAEGFNWLAYLIPPIAFLLGAFLLFRAFRIWRNLEKKSGILDNSLVNKGIVDDEYAARFEKELGKRK